MILDTAANGESIWRAIGSVIANMDFKRSVCVLRLFHVMMQSLLRSRTRMRQCLVLVVWAYCRACPGVIIHEGR